LFSSTNCAAAAVVALWPFFPLLSAPNRTGIEAAGSMQREVQQRNHICRWKQRQQHKKRWRELPPQKLLLLRQVIERKRLAKTTRLAYRRRRRPPPPSP